jgi:hypothetical protein
MYAGEAVVWLGWALFYGRPAVWAGLAIECAAFTGIVRWEEQRLLGSFGGEYRAYLADVARGVAAAQPRRRPPASREQHLTLVPDLSGAGGRSRCRDLPAGPPRLGVICPSHAYPPHSERHDLPGDCRYLAGWPDCKRPEAPAAATAAATTAGTNSIPIESTPARAATASKAAATIKIDLGLRPADAKTSDPAPTASSATYHHAGALSCAPTTAR